MRLGIVTALAAERACLPSTSIGDAVAVHCCGIGPDAARRAASELIEGGCTALLSFGFAGGLDVRLDAGAIIVAEAIITEQGEHLPTDFGWRRRLLARTGTGSLAEGGLFGSDRPLLEVSEKRALASLFAAAAVDMESHAVARLAQQAALPFAALRVVVDPAHRGVPGWLAGTIGADGRPRLRAVVIGACAHPQHVSQLIRLARDQRSAMTALRRVALDAGPLFALR